MAGNENTVGAAMITSDQMRKDFAKISLDYNLHNYPKFKELFAHQFEEMGVNQILERRKRRQFSESEPLLEGGSQPNSATGEAEEYIEYR